MGLHRNDVIRRLTQSAAGIALALVVATAAAGPALADCDGPVPSFRDHAAEAKRIVIGDVIDVDRGAPWTDDQGRSSRFTLRVRYVIRGPAERVMSLRDRAFLPCSDHIIIARKGDRVALALDAKGFQPPITFDTVAWIRGTPPEFAGIEQTTVREAFRLVGRELPETSTAPTPVNRQPSPGVLAALLAAAVTGTILWRLRTSLALP